MWRDARSGEVVEIGGERALEDRDFAILSRLGCGLRLWVSVFRGVSSGKRVGRWVAWFPPALFPRVAGFGVHQDQGRFLLGSVAPALVFLGLVSSQRLELVNSLTKKFLKEFGGIEASPANLRLERTAGRRLSAASPFGG